MDLERINTQKKRLFMHVKAKPLSWILSLVNKQKGDEYYIINNFAQLLYSSDQFSPGLSNITRIVLILFQKRYLTIFVFKDLHDYGIDIYFIDMKKRRDGKYFGYRFNAFDERNKTQLYYLQTRKFSMMKRLVSSEEILVDRFHEIDYASDKALINVLLQDYSMPASIKARLFDFWLAMERKND